MHTGMFTSLWIGTTILVGFVMVIIAAILFLLPQSPFSIPDPAPFILLFALIGSAAIAIGFPFYLQNQIENKKRDIDTQIPYTLAFMSILASPARHRLILSGEFHGRTTGRSPMNSARCFSAWMSLAKMWLPR